MNNKNALTNILKKSKIVLLSSLFSLSFLANANTQEALNDYADNVVAKELDKLSMTAVAFNAEGNTLKVNLNPNDIDIERVDLLWRELQRVWSACQAFNVANSQAQKIDLTPIDEKKIDNILNSINNEKLKMTPKYAEGLPANISGIEALEYMIYANSSARPCEEFDLGRIEYVYSAILALSKQIIALEANWVGKDKLNEVKQKALGTFNPQSETLSAKIKKAGKAGLAEILENCEKAMNDLALNKLEKAFKEEDSELLTSHYSGNTLCDIKCTVAGVKKSYNTLSALVAEKDKALDDKIKSSFDKLAETLDEFDSETPLSDCLDDEDGFNALISNSKELAKSLNQAKDKISK